MSGHDDSIAEIIPWYANGSATDEERRRVEAHLPSCANCRDLMDQARELASHRLDEGELADHPPAAILRILIESPQRIPEEARIRVQAHLHECQACRGAAEALAALETPGRQHGRGGAGLLWPWLTRTLLSPVMSMAYLVLLGVGLGWILTDRPQTRGSPEILPPAVSVPGELVFRNAPPGDAQPPLLLDRPTPPDRDVHLVLETDIDEADLSDAAAAFEVNLSQEGRVVWSLTVPGGAFSRRGRLGLLVPASFFQASPVTRIEILLIRPGDPMHGKVIYTRLTGIK